MIALIVFVCVAGLVLAFALGWRLGQRRLHSPQARLRFELFLPADTPPGDSVYLAGPFNAWHPADPEYRLTRTANLATGTWQFANGQMLEFKLTRGDWARVEKGIQHLEMPNRQLLISGPQTITGRVQVWSDQDYAADDIFDPRVERVELDSPILGVRRTMFVYVPPELSARPDERVPVVYLFRGHEREWVNAREDSSRGATNVIDVYQELRASAAIGPLVLVFPGLTSANGQVHSLGINMDCPELAHDSSIGTGQFEDHLLNEIIPFVEYRYPVLAGGAHRAIDGFSLGGFVSVNLALRNPGAFSSVGAYDGLYFWDDPATGSTVAASDTIFLMSLFDPSLGVPRSQSVAAANNPLNRLRTDGLHAAETQWLIEFGPEHSEPRVNYWRGHRLVELLHEHGVINELSGALPNGIHNWQHADDHMRRAFPLHWERIRQPTLRG